MIGKTSIVAAAISYATAAYFAYGSRPAPKPKAN